jgi:hypothetical protein
MPCAISTFAQASQSPESVSILSAFAAKLSVIRSQQCFGLLFQMRKMRNFGQLLHRASMRDVADDPQSCCIKAELL